MDAAALFATLPPEQQLEAVELALARESFPDFYRLLGRRRQASADGSLALDWWELWSLIDDTLDASWRAGRWVSLQAMPGLGKSTYARLRALWELGRDPMRNVAVISGTSTEAKKQVGLCRSIVAEPQEGHDLSLFRRIFPEVRPDFDRTEEEKRGQRNWEMARWYVRREGVQSVDPAFSAWPCVTRSEGARIDVLVADDAMTRDIAASPTKRAETCEAAFATWLEGRIVDEAAGVRGNALLMQNCWHPDDLAHRLLRDPRATSLWVGVTESNSAFEVRIVNPPDDAPILSDPERYGARRLDDERWEVPFPPDHPTLNKATLDREEEADPRSYARKRRNRPIADDDLMFPSWATRTRSPVYAHELANLHCDDYGRPIGGQKDADRLLIVASLDLSSRKRHGNFFSKWGMNAGRSRFPLEMQAGRWSLGEMVEALAESYARLPWRVLAVESVGVQDQIEEAIRQHPRARDFRHTIRGFLTTGSNKRSEEIGLPALDILLSNGTILWPDREAESGADRKWWAKFAADVATLPRVIPQGATPDGVMSWWFCDRMLTELGGVALDDFEIDTLGPRETLDSFDIGLESDSVDDWFD